MRWRCRAVPHQDTQRAKHYLTKQHKQKKNHRQSGQAPAGPTSSGTTQPRVPSTDSCGRFWLLCCQPHPVPSSSRPPWCLPLPGGPSEGSCLGVGAASAWRHGVLLVVCDPAGARVLAVPPVGGPPRLGDRGPRRPPGMPRKGWVGRPGGAAWLVPMAGLGLGAAPGAPGVAGGGGNHPPPWAGWWGHTFSAFWLRSSVVSVLISLISDTSCTAG